MQTTPNEIDLDQTAGLLASIAMLSDDLEEEMDVLELVEAQLLLTEYNLGHLVANQELLKTYYVATDVSDQRLVLITDTSFIEVLIYTQGVARVMYTVWPMVMGQTEFAPFELHMVSRSEAFPVGMQFHLVGWQSDFLQWRNDDDVDLYINREYTSLFTDLEVCIKSD